MKTIIFIISLLVLSVNLSFAQIPEKQIKPGTKELETSSTLYWYQNVKSSENVTLSVATVIQTVNTSNFEGDIYLDASPDGTNWANITSSEDLTFTQSSGVNSTVEYVVSTGWAYSQLRVRVVATSDAQTVNITPYIKTVK